MLNYQRVSKRNNFWGVLCARNEATNTCKCELESTNAEDVTNGATSNHGCWIPHFHRMVAPCSLANCGALSEFPLVSSSHVPSWPLGRDVKVYRGPDSKLESTRIMCPLVKRTNNYGKSPFLMGKFTIHGNFQ